MRTRCRSDTSNSGGPEPPELISIPSSTFREVTTPSKGAASVLNDCMASSWRTLASLASTTACFAFSSAVVWSASCWATICFCSSMLFRLAVSDAICSLALTLASVDGGQHLSGLHRRSDVVVPALHISVHPRENRRPVKGLDIARQRQRLMAAAGDGLSEGNGRGRLRVGPLHDLLLALRAA